MKNIFLTSFTYTMATVLMTACQSGVGVKNRIAQVASSSNVLLENTSPEQQKIIQVKEKEEVALDSFKNQIKNPQDDKKLPQQTRSVRMEVAPLDYVVVHNDTIFNDLEISFSTICLNDKGIEQDVFFYENNIAHKSTLLTHNYSTLIEFRRGGKVIAKAQIYKDLFYDKLEKSFVEKSVLKHPDLVHYDAQKQEATFQFVIGIPSTDWLVVARMSINSLGQKQILGIDNVSL
ncbi:MAG: DUF4738 domain-containing protein [Cytophagales bacterium]|nr:MAG: DUF4738 domain-containing protein [Cytophagales bacterium]